jgi:hypothetical protein
MAKQAKRQKPARELRNLGAASSEGREVHENTYIEARARGEEGTSVIPTAELTRLLRAYREGHLTEQMFEQQLRELNRSSERRAQTYTYVGILGLGPTSFSTEHEMILHLLDEFRCGENFAAEFLSCWIEISDQEWVKGGLRVMQQRENYHAQLLEARLRELGGTPRCTVPAARRKLELRFYSSKETTDADKLRSIFASLEGKDIGTLLKPLTDAIDQIQEDQQTKELLRALIDDEMASGKWCLEAILFT